MTYTFRPYDGEHAAVAAVRARCAARDGADPRSVVEGVPTDADIAEECARLSADNQLLVRHGTEVVGHAGVSWWREQDGTRLYLHRGFLVPEHRGRGVGSAMLAWAERRIRELVDEHGTAASAVFGANAQTSATESTALLLDAGYRPVFSLVELEYPDLSPPEPVPPAGITLGPIAPDRYRDAWRTVVDSYVDRPFVPTWTFESFLAEADPTCWRAAYDGDRMAGVALCAVRRPGLGVVDQLSVGAGWRRRGVGRAVLTDGLRCLGAHGASSVRLFTGTANPHRSYDLYQSAGFERRNEYVRYRKPVS